MKLEEKGLAALALGAVLPVIGAILPSTEPASTGQDQGEKEAPLPTGAVSVVREAATYAARPSRRGTRTMRAINV
jgi:hypothetical protein